VEYQQENAMTTFNIAVIFGPTLFGFPVLVTSPAPNGQGNGTTGISDMGLQNKVRLVVLAGFGTDAGLEKGHRDYSGAL
jgi:hypothetical protein